MNTIRRSFAATIGFRRPRQETLKPARLTMPQNTVRIKNHNSNGTIVLTGSLKEPAEFAMMEDSAGNVLTSRLTASHLSECGKWQFQSIKPA
jgi:hypothetical protein